MNFARRTNWELRRNLLSEVLQEHRASGRELFDLTASNPPDAGLAYDTPTILSAFDNPQVLQYHPEPNGLESSRRAVCDYYGEVAERTDSGQSVDPERLLLTTSTSEAYTYAFRLLCDPGDEVLIPTPSYPLFEYLAGLQDVRLVPYPLFYDHGWHIDLHSMRQAISERTRAIIVVNPNNPTGSYAKANERAELNALCAERNLALVVDEVFLDYSLTDPQPSFAFNRDALTFTLSGVSKISGLPQMKLAWMAVSGPEAMVGGALTRLEVIADTYLSMSAPVQLAAPVLLQQRASMQDQLGRRLKCNLSELDRQLGRGMVSRLTVEGGWYVVLRVPRIRSDEELAVALLTKENVLVQPGYFYDFQSEGYLVISLITPEQVLREGLQRTLRYLG